MIEVYACIRTTFSQAFENRLPAVLIGHDAFRLSRKRSMRWQSLSLPSAVLAGILASIASLISEIRNRQCIRRPEIRSEWPGRSPALARRTTVEGQIPRYSPTTSGLTKGSAEFRINSFHLCTSGDDCCANSSFMHLHFLTAICWRKALRKPAQFTLSGQRTGFSVSNWWSSTVGSGFTKLAIENVGFGSRWVI